MQKKGYSFAKMSYFKIIIFFLKIIYFWEGEGQRERNRGSQAESTEPNAGLQSTNRETMTWVDV